MKAGSENRRWLQGTRKNWLWLAQGALWLGGIVGAFLLPPPAGVWGRDDKTWLRLGQFIVAVILGLEILAARRWNRPRDAIWWGGVALVALALGVGAFFRYQELTLAWTAHYAGARVVTGSEFTAQGRAYTTVNPGLSTSELIFDFAGRTDEVWTRESIDRRRLALAAHYVACLPLFTICLLAVVQAMQAGGGAGKRRTTKAGG